MRVLLIKMSSLGDVLNALVGVTDAVRARPEITFDWVVEEAYLDIPGWHPAVQKIIPIALRRWRKELLKTLRTFEWLQFRKELRRTKYDVVLDAQGLYKSAWVGGHARGSLVGRSAGSAREGGAALLYTRRYAVDLQRPEVEQVRELFAAALGYPTAEGPADFGIDLRRIGSARIKPPYAVLLHGAAWSSKLWPEENWILIGKNLQKRGLKVLLPWGNEAEQKRARQIASHCGGEVLEKMAIGGLAPTLAKARLAVGLDTGLTHASVAFGVPTITLYGPSVPIFNKVAGARLIMLTSSESNKVNTSRPNTVAAERVVEAINELLG
ncbi:MAG TPA: lipopolysaccharide heptosyltransferase I [Verrucomicrobiae bacterium]|jgi:heptosyltransferase-1|nr:lipopolysaccharide heptosyltransferase I [Verrucomicrobiae bacterium]